MEADFALAQLDAAEGKPDDARKRLSDVASAHPDNIDRPSAPGAARNGHRNDRRRPSSSIRKVVALDPKDAMSFNALAYLLAESKQPDEALKYAHKARELAPDSRGSRRHPRDGLITSSASTPLAVVHLEAANCEGRVRPSGNTIWRWRTSKRNKADRGRQMLGAALKMDPELPAQDTSRPPSLRDRREVAKTSVGGGAETRADSSAAGPA